jgi:hypothetical protein
MSAPGCCARPDADCASGTCLSYPGCSRVLSEPFAERDDREIASELLGRLAGIVDVALDTCELPAIVAEMMREAMSDYRRWLRAPIGVDKGAA